MLSITSSKNSEAALRYFRESLSVQDYYSEKATIIGKWHGKAAQILGLRGEVMAKDFEALLFNVNPNTGKRLTARNAPSRRGMYDATFSAPKSVSVLYSLTGDKDVLVAHQTAVRLAMQAIEQDAQTQKGTGKNKHYHTTGNIVYAEFVHETARPIQQALEDKTEFIGDPQLHSHCAIINATFNRDTQRWRAIELGNVKSQASYYEALYHSYLGFALKQAGYQLEREGKRFEVKGVSKSVRDKFSGRTKEIERVAEERGIKSEQAKAALGKLTRHDKGESSVRDSELHQIWKDRLTLSEYQSLVSSKGYKDNDGNSGTQTMSASQALDMAFDHFFERQSGIEEKRLLGFAIDLVSGEIHPDKVKAELDRRTDVIGFEKNTVRHITTLDMIREEELMVEAAANGKNLHAPINSDYSIKNDMLNEGQKQAVQHVLGSTNKVLMVAGDAGVGKTTLMSEIKLGIEERGRFLFSFAPTADASRGQLRDKGFSHADTISKLINSNELQASLKKQVILIDEAGMVGVPTMNRILEIAETQNARVILSGDYKQHSSVERGDAMRILENQSGLPIARVKEIVRQRNNALYKDAIQTIAGGIEIKSDPDQRKHQVAKAFDKLDESGHIIEIEDRTERHKQMASDYIDATKASEKDCIVVAPTHNEGKEITTAIRHRLRKQDRIGRKDREFTHLHNLNLTGSEKQVPSYYSDGHIVEFHQNAKGGFKAGVKFQVTGKNDDGRIMVQSPNNSEPIPLPLDMNERYSVYEPQPIAMTQHDRLKITKNIKSMQGSKLFNGQEYTIDGFTRAGHIKLSNGTTLDKNAGHYDLGYYRTSIAAQGKDAKTVLLAQSSASVGAASDKQFYVSISRGVDNLKVFCNDKDALREQITRSGDRMSAGEIAEQAQLEQKKKSYAKQNIILRRVKRQNDLRINPQPQLQHGYEQRQHEAGMGREQGQDQPVPGL